MKTSPDSKATDDPNAPGCTAALDARAELLIHWGAIRNAPDVMTPDEADSLAAKTVELVRSTGDSGDPG